MTRARVAAAIAAIITALLLQAAVLTPLLPGVAISLLAVLVAAVALAEGPGTGVAFGFSAGLVADLASAHPAGVLALCWLGLGAVLGTAADTRSLLADALYVGLGCGASAFVSAVLLIALHADGVTASALPGAAAVGLVAAVLALLVVPVVSRVLRAPTLRPARTLSTEIGAGAIRG